jgi:hypothetical protein
LTRNDFLLVLTHSLERNPFRLLVWVWIENTSYGQATDLDFNTFSYDIGVISVSAHSYFPFRFNLEIQGCLIMPDFIDRFGQVGADGQMFLSSSRQSIITSLLSAG